MFQAIGGWRDLFDGRAFPRLQRRRDPNGFIEGVTGGIMLLRKIRRFMDCVKISLYEWCIEGIKLKIVCRKGLLQDIKLKTFVCGSRHFFIRVL